jgi:hypothetical protein
MLFWEFCQQLPPDLAIHEAFKLYAAYVKDLDDDEVILDLINWTVN